MFTSSLKPTKAFAVLGYMEGEETETHILKVFRHRHEAERYLRIEQDFDYHWIEETRFYE